MPFYHASKPLLNTDFYLVVYQLFTISINRPAISYLIDSLPISKKKGFAKFSQVREE